MAGGQGPVGSARGLCALCVASRKAFNTAFNAAGTETTEKATRLNAVVNFKGNLYVAEKKTPGEHLLDQGAESIIFVSLARITRMTKIHAISFSLGTRRCPLCDSDEVLRSHRRSLIEWTISPLLLRPFRCRECDARHIGFSFRRRSAKGTGGRSR